MSVQPVLAGRPLERLFIPGIRLGWTFRDRDAAVTPYSEPPPDPDLPHKDLTERVAVAQSRCAYVSGRSGSGARWNEQRPVHLSCGPAEHPRGDGVHDSHTASPGPGPAAGDRTRPTAKAAGHYDRETTTRALTPEPPDCVVPVLRRLIC